MDDPDNNKPEPNSVIGFAMTVVVGIGLTVVAVPILLLATCVPLMTGNQKPTLIAAGVYAAVAFIGGVVIAIRTRNTGIRWGVIALFCLAVAVAARYFL
jgi:hypothetical protein